jgi:hypothetical protein
MVEVFKTNVDDRGHADMLIDEIHQTFIGHKANFDLEDCDKILRVKCITGLVQSSLIIDFLKRFGFEAEILPDEVLTMPDIKLIRPGLRLQR